MIGNAGEPPALSVGPVSKAFDGEQALDKVTLSLLPGEIHGLLGHNGSGKSTLIKILAGFYTADEYGTFTMHGTELKLPLPAQQARQLGLAFVHQDLGLIGAATVAENLSISEFCERRRLAVSWRRQVATCQQLLSRYRLSIPANRLVSDLPPVEKALVAIVRALNEIEQTRSTDSSPPVLILDEPTAHLPRQDVSRLADILRVLREDGVSVIFVSHRTEEVLELTDRLSVLRDGQLVATRATSGLSEHDIELLILGMDPAPSEAPERVASQVSKQRVDEVSITDLSGAIVHDLAFSVAAGEVVGLTGLASAGATDVPALIFGATPASIGTLHMGNQSFDLRRMTPRRAMDAGIAFVPGDRLVNGVIGDLTLLENVVPLVGTQFSRFGTLRRKSLRQAATSEFQRFAVRPSGVDRKISALSGGNQQKVVLAKWLWNEPALLLLQEPTQGVDVGATEEIFRAIRHATEQGAAVICASTDEDDLAKFCDRVLVLRHGQIVTELRGEDVTRDAMRRAAG